MTLIYRVFFLFLTSDICNDVQGGWGTEDDLKLVLCPWQRLTRSLWVVLFNLVSVLVGFQNASDVFFDVRFRCGSAGGGMDHTACLGVCLLGWVVGCVVLILFLYVNRFKWHIFEVPTRRSVSGYIITAHRCHCILDCYWFSRAISHILAAWKKRATIRKFGHQYRTSP